MIRCCTDADVETMLLVINDAATAYKGVIPEDCWKEPYMSREALEHEIGDGIVFWGYEEDAQLLGVMGIQDRGPVTLFRHAYVRTARRNGGIGTQLLRCLEHMTDKPILIGTWEQATWAVRFYEKNGYRVLSRAETNYLLGKYWNLSELQIVTSVVLANAQWDPASEGFML
ncbi:MAG TPA: GNAT family N-acetyltransferase [Candidatus Hydrogenedentes bacterium]|nr:MAG: putative acetyltransferase [Candidatus Hydrogenedentes bacterium ADurb.Bin101]HOC69335.1 GNAT family N-acetyltransferase [Candidatus Hydrogenedentota bacterium]HQM99907.1 GNAT family N-acetyltransferase [Candidatus Hydrogenedentota bacterium]